MMHMRTKMQAKVTEGKIKGGDIKQNKWVDGQLELPAFFLTCILFSLNYGFLA